MKSTYFIGLFLVMFVLIVSCDSGSDNNGTSGGSGDISSGNTGNSSSDSGPVSNAATITLNAFSDFTCTNNWTNRDGALGLKAYTGSGSCVATFPGSSGTYSISFTAQTEHDGRPAYIVSINGQDVKGGRYPFAGGGCNCSPSECPDRNQEIGVGTYALNPGDKIGFWGQEDFPCGSSHGAYAKWHRMTFRRVN